MNLAMKSINIQTYKIHLQPYIQLKNLNVQNRINNFKFTSIY